MKNLLLSSTRLTIYGDVLEAIDLKKWFIVYALVIIVLSSYTCFSLSEGGLRLAVYIAPPVLPADGREHKCVYIQIQDSHGRPVKASSDVEVILTSSNLEVGRIEDSIVIPKGSDYAIAKFNTTLLTGDTVITASSPGFKTGMAVLKTVGKKLSPLPPYRFKVTIAPRVLPAVKGFKGVVSIQIVDRFNTPIEAPSDTRVILASSNISVLEVPDVLTIPKGCSYTVSFFYVKGVDGFASITALSQGFEPGYVIASVVKVGGKPARLALTPVLSTVPLDGGIHECTVAVELLDVNGAPAVAERDVKVTLASSNPDVVAVPDVVVIEEGNFYSTVSASTGFEGASTVLAASSQGLEADVVIVDAKKPISSSFRSLKLAAYTALPIVIADGEPKDVIVVQVQDDRGVPTALTQDVTVYLTSSVDLGYIPLRVVIKLGETYVVVPFTPLKAGETNITVSAQGLETSTVGLTALVLPVNVTVEAPSKVEVNQTYTVRLYADSLGFPLSDATVDWTVLGGEVISKINFTDAHGEAHLTVKQTSSLVTVIAQILKPGYETTTAIAKVGAISPPPTPRQLEVELLGFKLPVLQLMVGMACVIVFLIVVYLYLRRGERKEVSKGED